MKKLSHAATTALEIANRYRLTAGAYRAVGALMLATACEQLADAEMEIVVAEIAEQQREDGESA